MRRKYKPQRIGLNPKWFEIRIFRPLFKICIIAAVITFVFYQYNSYSEKKAIIEKEERLIKESIAAEERLKQESIRAKEEARREEELKQESIKQIELEKQRTNTLYENKVSRKVMPVGTYLKNTKENRVGRVVGYYGLEVITNNEWNFAIDSNGIVPDYINVIGYREYTKNLEKQKELEEKANKKANAGRLQKILDEEFITLTESTKKKLNTNYIKYNNESYRVWEVRGDTLYCTKKGTRKKKSNYIPINYSDDIKNISYLEYEINKAPH